MSNTAPGLNVDALTRHLDSIGMTLDPQEPPRRLSGGLANLNFLLHIDGKPVVLRSAPPGPLPRGAHDMAREHRVLWRLPDAFPLAPRSFHLGEDLAVTGARFQLMEYREGVGIRGDDMGPYGDQPEAPAQLAQQMAETLAALHQVDPAAVGLDDLGHPEGFLDRAIAGWATRNGRLPESERSRRLADGITAWLNEARSAVPDRAACLLHCDFKLDNLLLKAGTTTPVALLDWDMSTRGDPLFDLATLLSYWTEPGDPPAMQQLGQMPTATAGFPSRMEMAEAYAKASGRDLTGLTFMRVLCLFKLAVVFRQLYARWMDGALGDDRYAGFDALGLGIMEFALDQATIKEGI